MSWVDDLVSKVLSVQQDRARFDRAVRRGRVWAIANQVGVATQAGLSLTTPPLTLANPNGSGVRGKLWMVSYATEVAFAAGAVVMLALGSQHPTAVTGTLTTAQRNLKGGASGPMSVIRNFLAATLPAVPVAIDILGSHGSGAITVPLQMPPFTKWYDGAISLEEGCNLSIQTSTASGALGTWNAFIYEEEDK